MTRHSLAPLYAALIEDALTAADLAALVARWSAAEAKYRGVGMFKTANGYRRAHEAAAARLAAVATLTA